MTINFSIVIREVSFSKTEDLFLEFNLERSDYITLGFNVKTITLLIKAHFAGRIFIHNFKNNILWIYCKKS